MFKELYITILLLVLITFVNGAGMDVSIKNVPPNVSKVTAPDSITVLMDETTRVWCNTTVTDKNGYSDIAKIIGILWNENTSSEKSRNHIRNHYTSRYVLTRSTGDNISREVFVGFRLQPEAEGGTWVCKIEATDKGSADGYNTTTIKIYQSSCSNDILDKDEVLIDCGGICGPCIDVPSLFLEIPASRQGTISLNIHSRAGEAIQIVSIGKTNLRYDNESISSENIDIELPSKTIEPKGSESAKISISIPRITKNNTYNSLITIKANATISTSTNLTIRVLPPPPSYIELIVDKNCLDYPTIITTTDNETFEPLKDVGIIIYHKGKIVNETKTDKDGKVRFQPISEGTYAVRASSPEYPSEEKIVSILSCKIETCYDNVQDNNETGIDCGGSCSPCHCFDGKQNFNEKGLDCGGSCDLCPELPFTPKLAIYTIDELQQDENLSVQVKDTNGNLVQAILKVTKPNGVTTQLRTDTWGRVTLNMDASGKWSIEVIKAGHIPAEKTIMVKKIKVVSLLSKTISYISYSYIYIIAILLLLLLLYLKIRRF